tara:strand:+ start:275 stop:526 length:252 start_codon:yes stop_codon:yes gene_type:complete
MENNKIIAEFMGYKNPSNASDIWYHYDTSWDWLMPVASKCYDIDLGANRNSIIENLRDTLGEADITDVYTEVVKIIKFYNQNK